MNIIFPFALPIAVPFAPTFVVPFATPLRFPLPLLLGNDVGTVLVGCGNGAGRV
ncbi:MAG: hypothetical protein LBF22_06925 [Deltaproteobacteria bacterium]|nr:hypothetical protein [Deltaproteobacteria bacterium]